MSKRSIMTTVSAVLVAAAALTAAAPADATPVAGRPLTDVRIADHFDLLAGQIGSRHVMTPILEFLGEPAEAPAAVPGSVHEDEPCHRASIHHSLPRITDWSDRRQCQTAPTADPPGLNASSGSSPQLY